DDRRHGRPAACAEAGQRRRGGGLPRLRSGGRHDRHHGERDRRAGPQVTPSDDRSTTPKPTTRGERTMDFKLELVVLPVSDVDRAKAFYADRVGFNVDVDHRADPFRVVQLTPPGSACWVTIGQGVSEAAPGSV